MNLLYLKDEIMAHIKIVNEDYNTITDIKTNIDSKITLTLTFNDILSWDEKCTLAQGFEDDFTDFLMKHVPEIKEDMIIVHIG